MANNSSYQPGDVVRGNVLVSNALADRCGLPVNRLTTIDGDEYAKGQRPLVISDVPESGSDTYIVYPMATFHKRPYQQLGKLVQRFLIQVQTANDACLYTGHSVRATPEWENAPQYILAIPYKCQRQDLGKHFRSQAVDTSSGKRIPFRFDGADLESLDTIALDMTNKWAEEVKIPERLKLWQARYLALAKVV
ncbi:hypothetical protein VNI00_002034 [Paramarasmius palmivorus]|uniref:Uncharacterized protein n=1 Tax=Paramarasmius palmivorus TaxID=297713 RepID=A0AAW0E3V6_9AGAR